MNTKLKDIGSILHNFNANYVAETENFPYTIPCYFRLDLNSAVAPLDAITKVFVSASLWPLFVRHFTLALFGVRTNNKDLVFVELKSMNPNLRRCYSKRTLAASCLHFLPDRAQKDLNQRIEDQQRVSRCGRTSAFKFKAFHNKRMSIVAGCDQLRRRNICAHAAA